MNDTAAEAPPSPGLFARIRRLTESDGFEGIVATLLLMNAFALGLETISDTSEWDAAFWTFFWVSQGVFVLEIVLRVLGHGPRVLGFFKDGWNVFDFALVAISLVPAVGPLGAAARVIRVLRALRVLRLVSLFARRKTRDGDA